MESIFTELALYCIKNECARTNTVFLPTTEVCDGTVSLDVVDGKGLTNIYNRQIQGQSNLFYSNKNGDNELWDVTLASVDGQKFKGHKVILSPSTIF